MRKPTLASLIRGTCPLSSLIGTQDSTSLDDVTARLIRTTDEMLMQDRR